LVGVVLDPVDAAPAAGVVPGVVALVLGVVALLVLAVVALVDVPLKDDEDPSSSTHADTMIDTVVMISALES
jgi:hypothetical protein